MANLTVIKTCRRCAQAYPSPPKDRRSVYCPACRTVGKRELARERRRSGWCSRHPDRPTNGKCWCPECMIKHAAKNAERRKAAKAKGECPYHPGRSVASGRSRCAECLAKMVEGSRSYKYGLMPGEREAMLDAQGHRCALCGTDRPFAWHIDHDHVTGRVRGILCLNCNLMLGYAKDDPEVMAKAIDYLAAPAAARRKNG